MSDLLGVVLAGCGAAGIVTWWLQLRGAQRAKVAEMAFVPACRVSHACISARNPEANHDETVMAEVSGRLSSFDHADKKDLYPLVTLLRAEDSVDELKDAEVLIRRSFGPHAAMAVHRILHEYTMSRTDALTLARESHELGFAITQHRNDARQRDKRDKERSTWLREGGTAADRRLRELEAALESALKGPLHFALDAAGVFRKLRTRP